MPLTKCKFVTTPSDRKRLSILWLSKKSNNVVWQKMVRQYLTSTSSFKSDEVRRRRPWFSFRTANSVHNKFTNSSTKTSSCHFFSDLFLPTTTKRRDVSLLLYIIVLLCLLSDKPVWWVLNFMEKRKYIFYVSKSLPLHTINHVY